MEWCQKNHFDLRYELITESHDDMFSPTFESEVYAENIFLGRGKGYAKKESQQKASEQALGRIKKDADLRAQIVEAKQKREQSEAEQQETVPEIEKKEEFVSARETLEIEMPRRNNRKEDVISAAEDQAYKELS